MSLKGFFLVLCSYLQFSCGRFVYFFSHRKSRSDQNSWKLGGVYNSSGAPKSWESLSLSFSRKIPDFDFGNTEILVSALERSSAETRISVFPKSKSGIFREKLKDSDSHDFGAPDELYTPPSFQEFWSDRDFRCEKKYTNRPHENCKYEQRTRKNPFRLIEFSIFALDWVTLSSWISATTQN